LLDFFDLIESDASSITMYQRKKFRAAVTIYKELLIGEQERRRGVKTLADLDDPVACVEVQKILRVRSDNIKRKLGKNNYPVVKSGGINYCNSEDVAVLWPKWKKHIKKQKLE